MISPYANKPVEKWPNVTKSLINIHPLSSTEVVEIVLKCWDDIFRSNIGSKPFHIGKDILPKPQIMGFLLHELIPLELEKRYPKLWRRELDASDKDLIYIPNAEFSVEIKTSSNKDKIFGNRSYAQEAITDKKNKSGYYLTVNFEKFTGNKTNIFPKILLIRFGWVDHSDWRGQSSATGQQSSLSPDVYRYKLPVIYSAK